MTSRDEHPDGRETIIDLLGRWARLRPDAPFFKCTTDWITYGELDRRTDAIAAALIARGLQPGDRVAIVLSNCDAYIESIFALAKIGAIQVPINTFLKGEFLRYQLAQSGARALIADRPGIAAADQVIDDTDVALTICTEPDVPGTVAFAELHEPTTMVGPVGITPDATASIVFTSGTTGMPKGCMLPHGYLTTIPHAYIKAGWMRSEDRMCTPFPLFHISGQVIVLMTTLALGASVLITPSFSARSFMKTARDDDATMLFGIGAMGLALLAQPPDPDEPRGFRLATWIPMTAGDQAAFTERFETPVICEGYGQTECAPALINSVEGERRPGTAGRPVSYLQVRLLDASDRQVPPGDVGEIAIRPDIPNAMFSGYWNDPGASHAASRTLWHHTGDYGRADSDGYITFVDRKNDAMRRRGENVSSLELERAILKHPAITACAVHSVTSSLGEDDIKACIVTKDERPSLAALFSFFSDSLPYYCVPAYIEFLPSLPVNALGRVMKHELRARGLTPETIDFAAHGFTIDRANRRAQASPC